MKWRAQVPSINGSHYPVPGDCWLVDPWARLPGLLVFQRNWETFFPVKSTDFKERVTTFLTACRPNKTCLWVANVSPPEKCQILPYVSVKILWAANGWIAGISTVPLADPVAQWCLLEVRLFLSSNLPFSAFGFLSLDLLPCCWNMAESISSSYIHIRRGEKRAFLPCLPPFIKEEVFCSQNTPRD